MNILTANINKMDENAWKQKAFAEHAYSSNLISQTKNNSDKFREKRNFFPKKASI